MYDEERPYAIINPNRSEQERQALWDAAAGMQAVDGLTVSARTYDTAQSYIAGTASATEIRELVEKGYSSTPPSRQSEADIVAVRINELLDASKGTGFRCNPSMLLAIHRTLFEGQFENPDWAGHWRRKNITKKEPVLGGRSVEYTSFPIIEDALRYDFEENSRIRYTPPLDAKQLARLVDFFSGIWQVHPFREGNTRTIATFSLLYLGSLGVEVDNTLFKEHSTAFRDALVRASYSSIQEGIEEDHSFIYKMYENLVLGANHDLAALDMNLHGIRVSDIPYRDVPQESQTALERTEPDTARSRSGRIEDAVAIRNERSAQERLSDAEAIAEQDEEFDPDDGSPSWGGRSF